MFGSTLKRRFSPTIPVVVGLVLGFAIVSPASAPAKAGGVDRPIKGSGSGTIRVDPVTGAFTGDVPQVASQLGVGSVHMEGVVAPSPDGTFAGSGTATLTAANGDRLTGTITLSQTAAPGGQTTTTVVVHITGGTGRFAGATGTLTVICHSGPPDEVGGSLLIDVACRFTGQVTY